MMLLSARHERQSILAIYITSPLYLLSLIELNFRVLTSSRCRCLFCRCRCRCRPPQTTIPTLPPSTMALRMLYHKAMGFAAKQYRTVLGNQLAQYGEFVLSLRFFRARGLYLGCGRRRRRRRRRIHSTILPRWEAPGRGACIGKRVLGGRSEMVKSWKYVPGDATCSISIDQTNSPP